MIGTDGKTSVPVLPPYTRYCVDRDIDHRDAPATKAILRDSEMVPNIDRSPMPCWGTEGE